MPVQGATKNSYNQNAYWYYPWGKSVTHKGVDIFAKEGTAIHPATSGLVIYTGQIAMGGNVVFILGPKWRFHYYAHVNEIKTSTLRFVSKKSIIATVGATGNAKGKSPHLHYSIMTLFPYFWLADKSVQGWKKMFYLNPITYLNDALNNTSAQ
ncbi:MAG: M23 family metallopeptidase [Deinococcales bacterium]|nr:M23 family metallopeptidase [Chitinophagaceae bacterium]